ncbi:MAG: enoyl-CoA hydratase/isomerase family protein [Dehalococcoidia bacterium]|nr:enoyl-CoA hydratase/isomerase family protein [Dehalococcoidia bacterium]
MTDELVHLDIHRGVGTITLDSPSNRNALSVRLVSDLARQLDAALADDAVRVIVLTGTGPVFCSGADLKEQRAANESGDPSVAQALLGRNGLAKILQTIMESPKPVVAKAQGTARAGGLGLVAASDIAVGVEGTTFALTEARLGLAPGVISVALFPRLGVMKARELFQTGDTFDAAEAARIGLLNAVVPADQLDAKVDAYIASLLKAAPRALAAGKEIVWRVPSMPLGEAFDWMAQLSAEFFNSADGREGMTSFAEKRQPGWVIEYPG